jgi:hypothetical protein
VIETEVLRAEVLQEGGFTVLKPILDLPDEDRQRVLRIHTIQFFGFTE